MAIKTYTDSFSDACILELTVNTTGLKGGDAGHGGFTEIILKDNGSTAMMVNENQQTDRIAFKFLGDAELRVLAQALRAAANFLDQQINLPID